MSNADRGSRLGCAWEAAARSGLLRLVSHVIHREPLVLDNPGFKSKQQHSGRRMPAP